MVKNAGPLFEQVLKENMEIMDRWTVLDTGSTDGTQDIVRRVLEGKKKGQLVEEPFLNFRDSRNRCLELAGRACKYTLMLDDTYAIRGNLRRFLNLIRGDAFANSYSLLIQSDDSEYYSNRLLKTEEKLRYIYTIHEVVQAERNVTVVIPKEDAWIYDYRAPYMENRTKDRKLYDLKCLFEMLEEEPDNPRHLYYLAQTYSCLEDYEKAAHWFERRANATGGHHQEAVDAMFELGRLYNFKLEKPWSLCEETYKKAYAMDPSRPDSLYFIGIHYYLEGGESDRAANRHIAYTYFKQGFALGYPVHAQFSLKPTLSFHFLPKFLAELCYAEGDWQLGLAAANRFLEHAKPTNDSYSLMKDWQVIYGGLVGMGPIAAVPRNDEGENGAKPLLVIVADGGWGPWTGRDLVEKGVGGSETWVIETARWIQREGTYRVVVFCRCQGEETFEDVEYRPIEGFGKFVAAMEVQTCIVSRYSEYVPMAIAGHAENVYLILHDIGPTGSIIPLSPKLKKIWCLTEWHKGYFLQNFPQCADRTDVLGYGLDLEKFNGGCAKTPYSFIYSSFPNRGLLPLLQMWPKIKARWPAATLDVYSDIEGEWVNRVAKEEMAAIRALLLGGLEGVVVHGWVSKGELAAAWRRAEVWLYPCVFAETFCLTALEAQAAGVLVVCPPLAALQDTVGIRGLLVGTGRDVGEARAEEWQLAALQALGEVLDDRGKKDTLVGAGQVWANGRSWESVTKRVVRSVFTPTIVVKPRLDVAGMYNWTHDIPTGTKRVFEEVLQGFVGRGARILEIGTYAGTSLIGMLERLPDATAVAVDRWKNYDENGLEILSAMEERGIEAVFWKNVKAAGMEGRIVARKGDSVDVLMEMIEERGRGGGELFDFVYVDGSHKCIDCYTDMTLGWRLLKKGGVMGIDDYLYRQDRVMAGELLEFPMKGIDWFLEKRKGEYRVLSVGWRVFLEKI
jgi:glycosyltransferase involved in cell wall biosynthesis